MLKAYRGSPPHARGKVQRLIHGAAKVGITPACAGKRSAPRGARRFPRDHPRIRGEKPWSPSFSYPIRGSPPHTRGKEHQPLSQPVSGRITPAYAGKSAAAAKTSPGLQDHPRIRGEKFRFTAATKSLLGSPPHTREKASLTELYREKRRITPAYAGKRCLLML